MDDHNHGGSFSGLSAGEAQEFHRLFMTSFIVFTLIAIVAHFLVWSWRPWFPGPTGYTTSMIDGAQTAVTHALTYFS